MARTIPVVRGNALIRHHGTAESSIVLGTPAWYDWLSSAESFHFDSPRGSFTARKERVQRGGWYWKAYRSHLGKVYKAYLGRSEALASRRLLDEGATMASLLAKQLSAYQRGRRPTSYPVSTRYVRRPLAAFDVGAAPDPALRKPVPSTPSGRFHEMSRPLAEPFSERELQVLRSVASGASNQEIARQLVDAVGTVKWHIGNVFGKLGVHNRTSAVA